MQSSSEFAMIFDCIVAWEKRWLASLTPINTNVNIIRMVFRIVTNYPDIQFDLLKFLSKFTLHYFFQRMFLL